MISPSGRFDMKFALVNFLVDKNDFTKNFLELRSSAKEFVRKYKQVIRSAGSPTPSTSGAPIQAVVTIDDVEDAALDPTLHKTPVRKGNKNKRKSSTPSPEGAELLSPEKVSRVAPLLAGYKPHYGFGSYLDR